eukprot:scaffold4891_cov140-Cylindrotheca_fusiformis.AAC.3
MVTSLTYKTVSDVTASWDALKRVPNYKERAGLLLFKKFFNFEPRALAVYNFAKDAKVDDHFFKTTNMIIHAKRYITALDGAVGMLGPNIEMLTEILTEMGQRHVKYGVLPAYYPPMGRALLEMMEEILGAEEFTPDIKESWRECYQIMAHDMAKASNK